jgi:hypothetical protein
MAITKSPFDTIAPYIEFVEYECLNPRDSNKVIFRCAGDPATVIKWCRRNFGNRGDGWDFSGSDKAVDITIWSTKLITMYELWQN